MDDVEYAAAVAAQAEHVKRQRSCEGGKSGRHVFRLHGRPGSDGIIPVAWSQCLMCQVTETQVDYTIKIT